MEVWTDPEDLAVGHVVTAAEWNLLLGENGSLAYLGNVHAHDGAPGSGGTLDVTGPALKLKRRLITEGVL